MIERSGGELTLLPSWFTSSLNSHCSVHLALHCPFTFIKCYFSNLRAFKYPLTPVVVHTVCRWLLLRILLVWLSIPLELVWCHPHTLVFVLYCQSLFFSLVAMPLLLCPIAPFSLVQTLRSLWLSASLPLSHSPSLSLTLRSDRGPNRCEEGKGALLSYRRMDSTLLVERVWDAIDEERWADVLSLQCIRDTQYCWMDPHGTWCLCKQWLVRRVWVSIIRYCVLITTYPSYRIPCSLIFQFVSPSAVVCIVFASHIASAFSDRMWWCPT